MSKKILIGFLVVSISLLSSFALFGNLILSEQLLFLEKATNNFNKSSLFATYTFILSADDHYSSQEIETEFLNYKNYLGLNKKSDTNYLAQLHIKKDNPLTIKYTEPGKYGREIFSNGVAYNPIVYGVSSIDLLNGTLKSVQTKNRIDGDKSVPIYVGELFSDDIPLESEGTMIIQGETLESQYINEPVLLNVHVAGYYAEPSIYSLYYTKDVNNLKMKYQQPVVLIPDLYKYIPASMEQSKSNDYLVHWKTLPTEEELIQLESIGTIYRWDFINKITDSLDIIVGNKLIYQYALVSNTLLFLVVIMVLMGILGQLLSSQEISRRLLFILIQLPLVITMAINTIILIADSYHYFDQLFIVVYSDKLTFFMPYFIYIFIVGIVYALILGGRKDDRSSKSE